MPQERRREKRRLRSPYRHEVKRKLRYLAICLGLVLVVGLGIAAFRMPEIGAAMILHPVRKPVSLKVPAGCTAVTYSGEGIKLAGWKGMAPGKARGTVIYLHGLCDNRASGAGILKRYLDLGFDVIAYDSRAHGQSEGDACTYGWLEKKDLLAVVESVEHPPVLLIGGSLGAAVAIQAAAMGDKRIAVVVAAETFSDLRTVANERAPSVFSEDSKAKAFRIAEEQGGFSIDDVSPVMAARMIRIPVLLIHGDADVDTPPEHTKRVFHELAGAKRLILVPGARHSQSLNGSVWDEIDAWIDQQVPGGQR